MAMPTAAATSSRATSSPAELLRKPGPVGDAAGFGGSTVALCVEPATKSAVARSSPTASVTAALDPPSARDGNVTTYWRRRRSEEHTSELTSLMRISYTFFCLKKQIILNTQHDI